MKEFFSRIKMDVIISAVCCIAFGVVLLLWPAEVTTLACKAIGILVAVLGLVRMASYMINSKEKHGIYFPIGMALFFVGLWIFLRPSSIQSLLLIGIGVVLFVHGIEDFKYALETKRGGYGLWWTILLLALLGMGLGAACIVDSFGMISVTLTFVGIVLIYEGVSELWIVFQVVRAAKVIKKEMEYAQPIDVDAEDLTEDTGEEVTEESEMR